MSIFDVAQPAVFRSRPRPAARAAARGRLGSGARGSRHFVTATDSVAA